MKLSKLKAWSVKESGRMLAIALAGRLLACAFALLGAAFLTFWTPSCDLPVVEFFFGDIRGVLSYFLSLVNLQNMACVLLLCCWW